MTLTEFRTKSKPEVKLAIEGQLIAVWGPLGSTGKSTVALNVAYELSQMGQRVILLDLDTHSPALAQLLPIKTGTAGLAGAARLIRQGRFTPEELERLSVTIRYRGTKLKLLQGLANPSRWPEVTPDTVSQLVSTAKFNHDFLIADIASPIEDQLSSPEHSTQRNSATRTALRLSVQTITVLAGTHLSLSRYLNSFNALNELQKVRRIVLNRAPANQKLAKVLNSLTKESLTSLIPADEPALELAESQQLPLALARRKSPARNALLSLAHKLLEWQPSVN
jgi:MinD-like ATPase involved in chromosome partitioning or flagellar assembly